MAYQLTKAYRV